MDNHEVFAVIATLVVGFLFFFIYGLRKIYKGSKEEVKKTTVSTIYWILVPAAVFALSAIVVATYTFIKQPDYYKVLDIYNTGVGVRCLTDGKYKTTVIPLSEGATKPLKEFDVIDKCGNIIIDGAWLGAQPAITDETATTDAS